MIDERWRSARRILAVRLGNTGDMPGTTPLGHVLTLAPEVEAPDGAVGVAR